jgi:hypothetical protein
MRCKPISMLALSLVFVAALPIGRGSPLKETFAKGTKVSPDGWTTTEKFRAGERASVQVVNVEREQKNFTTVVITVHDSAGVEVAKEVGRGSMPDITAVFWYPPRDGEYKITVSNQERREQTYFICIR